MAKKRLAFGVMQLPPGLVARPPPLHFAPFLSGKQLLTTQTLPSAEAGRRVGVVIMATIAGMALGGWMSGWIYDLTGSYAAAFLNGFGWNLLNVTIMVLLLLRLGGAERRASRLGEGAVPPA